jgi:hypothetical protein
MSHEESTVITGTRQSAAQMTRDEITGLLVQIGVLKAKPV